MYTLVGGMALNGAQSGVSASQRFDSFLAGTAPTAPDILQLNSQVFQGGLPADPTRGVHGVQSGAPINQFGNTVVNGAQDVRAAFRDTINNVKRVMAGGMEGMGTTQFLQIQMDLMQLNITLEFSTKVSDKGSQSLQTLFRNQG
ncbi:MAG: EscI/YscI/HrpB family type III secretion system inner rod protein [Puniceicoccales bacterium]|nr:EscI/YscI/HrpB family type III secretion system inner rod protein [Puniceicoccales bacterium]